LKDIGVKLIVITIDGHKDLHNNYRFLKNGRETYEKILKNITKIYQTHGDTIKFNIRTNFDKNNVDIDNYELLIKDFKQIGIKNISFIFSQIQKTISGNGSNVFDVLSNEEYNEIENKIRKILIKYNFNKSLDFLPKKLDYFNCYAGSDNGFAINYNGDIYKCFGDVNPPQNQVGKLLEDGNINYFPNEIIKWYNYDFFESSKCRSCVILPTCMGGCVKIRLGFDIYNNSECDREKAVQDTKEKIRRAYLLS
jgi:uncharacterized protein